LNFKALAALAKKIL
uniref:Polistes-mastoparan-R2 n=1 Tax=Polistes rothneyi TaxID=30208 RepID=MAST2_POLRT|nr:RecName: Full=Polistes-mastoparan-R2; Short=Pm-R2 [Polistes rothneyi]